MPRVLLIEDDRAVREGVALALRRQNHDVSAAATGEEGLAQLRSFRPDIVVLDLMLPGMPGLEVCRGIRAVDQALPVIMATARGDEVDIVIGLEAGADDYVVKPVTARVLDARIRAVLRRAGGPPAGEGLPKIDTYGELTVDRAGLTVSLGGDPISLAPSELRLLLTLSASPGQVFSRQQLLEAVWEHDFHGDARLVDACVKRLRTKMAEPPRAPRYIHTVRGFGYRFAAP
ncbi:MAG: response regulator transcription factor [Streptomyces sp.]|nr:response regulator transcription factor [Streptomyces sp.]NUR42151.1 response regulator transcription factor [Streptomyces sp.]NUR65185.1 response regulator transcription factor [Streptomyces sp.]NUS27683.1 response regulator transcription factor [Streptomyces sp.]NUS81129.1 response regulator transcription factor [Streptomyces sp.]